MLDCGRWAFLLSRNCFLCCMAYWQPCQMGGSSEPIHFTVSCLCPPSGLAFTQIFLPITNSLFLFVLFFVIVFAVIAFTPPLPIPYLLHTHRCRFPASFCLRSVVYCNLYQYFSIAPSLSLSHIPFYHLLCLHNNKLNLFLFLTPITIPLSMEGMTKGTIKKNEKPKLISSGLY